AVRALSAGADALCLGHDLGSDGVESFVEAIVDAVRGGRLAEERLVEAADRVRHLATGASNTVLLGRGGSRVGLEAARRAVRAEGQVELTRPPRVVELPSELSIAAGEAAVGLGDVLAGAETVRGDVVPAP